MAFTVKTKARDDADTYTTESNVIAYKVRWLMNDMAQATVTLNDVNFASTQKYMELGTSTYLGYGTGIGVGEDGPGILIEEPTNTEVFEGFIHAVIPNPQQGTCDLICYDLLYQLSKQKILYDTRADLDGSGLRESRCYRMVDADDAEHGIYDDSGVSGFYRLYDTVAGWSNGDFHGGDQYYLVFSNKMANNQTIWHGVRPGGVSGTVVTVLGGEADDTWHAAGFWDLISTNNGDDWTMVCPFRFLNAYTTVEQVDFEIRMLSADSATGMDGPLQFQVYNHRRSGAGLAAGYYNFATISQTELVVQAGGQKTWQWSDIGAIIGVNDPGDIVATDGDIDIKILADAKAADKAELTIGFMRVTAHVEGTTTNTTAYAIDEDNDNYVAVSENLITANIDKHAPYFLTRVITKYVADLVTTYDAAHTLDAASDVVASTNVVGRHYHYMTPLDILKDLAQADGTEFWLDDGDDLHWNDAYATGGAPTITDSDVVYWINPSLNLEGLGNDIVVLGQRQEDSQITGTSNDATEIENYGRHTRVVESPHIYGQKDATDQATALEAWYEAPVFNMGYVANGFSTYDVGTVLEIQSTDFNINAGGGGAAVYYVVTEKRYNSRAGFTQLFLTKRSTNGLFRAPILEDGLRAIQGDIAHTKRHVDFTPLHTETW
jgi:hypothetical protein